MEQRLFLQQELEGPFRVTHIFVHVSNIGTAHVGPSLSEVFVWIKKTCREGGSCLIGCWSLLTILEQPKISGKKRCQEKCSFSRRCQIDALPVQIVCPRFRQDFLQCFNQLNMLFVHDSIVHMSLYHYIIM